MLQAVESADAPIISRAGAEERRRMSVWLEEQVAAGKIKPHSQVLTLTPVLAGLLLDRNPVNRPIIARNANSIASDIASGRFKFNGESMVVANNGTLIDGQHRALQVVQTGRSIQTVIVFGPEEDARFSIDTGRPKSASNFLAMKGRHYTGVLATVASYHLQWRQYGFINTGGHNTPTKSEILAAADELKGVDTSIEITVPAMKTVRSHATLAFCHYVFWRKSSRENADHFVLRVIEGDNLRKGDPILYCRNRLLQMNRLSGAGQRIELVFKCWNAFRLGVGIDHFKLSGGKLPKLER